ncbi:MAG: glucose-1-phosphate cytidylyltransferase [Deltaproteobacteria bacterium]|nr:glucose-1-phosphate cytidylyltransferase [Deltaproteobacteria bacterium]
MNVVILAGGLGTRLAEETDVRPKPMVEIGGHPILWHLMKFFAHQDFASFHVALGYRGDVVKRYFLDHYTLNGSMRINLSNGAVTPYEKECENWDLHLIETGMLTMTGGRLKRLEPFLKEEPFILTYGDGLSDVNLQALWRYHKQHGCLATITAVRPPARFGEIIFEGNKVAKFSEKPQTGEGWINGGFMVLEPQIFDYLRGDQDILESDLLEKLAAQGQLTAYRHDGFWQCMDTLRDRRALEALWKSGKAPWRVWL